MSSVIEILPNLWIGHYGDCGNLLSFSECNIDTIINACNRIPFTIGQIQTFDITFQPDEDYEHILHKMIKTIDFIHNRLSRNKFILIYSLQDDQIDSTIVVCYLMKYGQMDPKNAINAVSSKRTNEFYKGLLFKSFIFSFYEYVHI
tara:strand:- start:56 stop:493 length:438 start_codon:yes stop_codon:yes gene_type:complete